MGVLILTITIHIFVIHTNKTDHHYDDQHYSIFDSFSVFEPEGKFSIMMDMPGMTCKEHTILINKDWRDIGTLPDALRNIINSTVNDSRIVLIWVDLF